ncbi:unnamed protein product [Paramecium primaurelia]|uniref:Cyclic nucleotide-binding domain-containing protein n=1 Tax=Paramecium primaurelia TaxID=5886 RepID=A0A8S1QH84_PARPR|nr:unnamed protein product [Paramecium primaurelia]
MASVSKEQIKIQEDEATNVQLFILQTEKLKKLLYIQKDQRDENILSEIASIAKQIGFLSKYKDRPYFTALCKHLYMQTFQPNSCIFKQGDEGDKFYVILNGSVRVLIDQATTLKDVMIKKEVAQLKKGEFFGEMALQFNLKRTATIITNEITDLIILENEAFQQFMLADHMQTERVKETINFLEQLDIFQGFSNKIMVSLSTKCIQNRHKHQTILLKAGTVPNKLFIIKSGCVTVIQKLPGVKSDYTPQVEYGFPLNEYFELTELGEGEIFGDLAMLKQEKSKYTYMTAIESEIITLSLFDIKQIVPPELLDQYLIKLQTYPEQSELKEMIIEKGKWEKYKKQLFNKIQKEKQSRKGFNQGLRLPTLNDSYIQPPNKHNIKAFVINDKRQRLTPVEKRLFVNELNYIRQSVSNERLKKFLQSYQ